MFDWLLQLFGPDRVDPSVEVCHLSDYYEHQFQLQPARCKPAHRLKAASRRS